MRSGVLNVEASSRPSQLPKKFSIKMKFSLGVLLTFAVAVYGQTVTEGLLSAQADLALGHEFFETTLFLNRGQISAYLYRINREIIDSHINTYAFIKNLGIETRTEFEAIPSTPENTDCLNNILNRWDLQVVRYGHRLATCVNQAYRLIAEWNGFLNNLHATGQVTGNQVQNLGLKVLSETEIFDGQDSLPDQVNREFRELLKGFLAYRERFDGFLDEISADVLDTIRELVSCDVVLEEEFEREVTNDLARGRACAELVEGTADPIPT